MIHYDYDDSNELFNAQRSVSVCGLSRTFSRSKVLRKVIFLIYVHKFAKIDNTETSMRVLVSIIVLKLFLVKRNNFSHYYKNLKINKDTGLTTNVSSSIFFDVSNFSIFHR